MPRYTCRTHGVVREVDESKRLNTIRAPSPVNCALMRVKEPREGKFGECEIVRVE